MMGKGREDILKAFDKISQRLPFKILGIDAAMNSLYENELRLYMNLFQPSVKLFKTERKGSRKNRFYSRPLTPLDRLLSSEHIDQSQK